MEICCTELSIFTIIYFKWKKETWSVEGNPMWSKEYWRIRQCAIGSRLPLLVGLVLSVVILHVARYSLIGPGYLVRRGPFRMSGNADGNEHAEIRQGVVTAGGHLNMFLLRLLVSTYLGLVHSLTQELQCENPSLQD